MEYGELLTRWTVRAAVVLYVAGLASRHSWPRASRLAWTGGCGAYLLHVVAAFHYYHHWSHADAYASTARQTAEVTGIDFGGGLYVNYVFTLVWVGGVVLAWRDVPTPRWARWLIDGFLAFVVFNATVVFATGFSRWFGVGACMVLAVIRLWPRKENTNGDAPHGGRPGVDRSDDR